MQYVLLFLEGIITFISPCLLPMLPIYVSYFAGKEEKPLANSIGFVAGFTVIFVALGAFAGVIGGFLQEYSTVVNIVAGLFIVALGLSYMGVLRLPRLPVKGGKWLHRVTTSPLTFTSSILFGMVFAVAWTPCVSAFLGAALLRASLQGSAAQGMLMLFVFSMGLGLPFIASAVLINRLKGAFDFIKKHYRVVNAAAGSLLVLIGVLIMTGIFGRYLALFA
ncbi:MAG: cytochrome c biogenesis protein CcdA [Firmicutes bacterium]|nr:cytochrome c biogenesis protein CcdA [Bacillota bacterium]